MTDKKFWREEKSTWMLIGALVISTVVFAFVQIEQYDWLLSVEIGLMCSYSGVLAIWAIFGSQRLPTRIVTFLLAMPAVWLAVAALLQDENDGFATGLLMLFQAVFCVIFFGLLRFASWQIGRGSVVESGDSRETNHFQFSIRWLLALTGAIAVLLASGRAVGAHVYVLRFWDEIKIIYNMGYGLGDTFFMLGMMVLPMAVGGVGLFWATGTALLSAGRLVVAMVVSGLVVYGTLVGIDWYWGPVGDEQHDVFKLTYSIHFSATAAGLSVLRRAGWLRVPQQWNTEAAA